MDERERFLKTMHFEPVDRPPLWEMIGFWDETIERWKKEGLPESVKDINAVIVEENDIWSFFGFDRREIFNNISFPEPRFEVTILEENENARVLIDQWGVKRKESKIRWADMPQYLEFPIRDRKTFEELKYRYRPDTPGRYSGWEDCVSRWKERDYPVGIWAGKFFDMLRGLIGLENLWLLLYDDPKFIQEVLGFLCEFYINTVTKAVSEIKFDFAIIAEDLGFHSSSLISPAMFREFILPHYKRLTRFLRSYGIDIILIDSDGNNNDLIPLFLEGGANGLFPLEVAAHMDLVELRKNYGERLLLIGGIDKRVLIDGNREKIKREVLSKVPFLFSSGGYIASIDHNASPDISFETYKYYLGLIRAVANKKTLKQRG